jgi:hypothetical protein
MTKGGMIVFDSLVITKYFFCVPGRCDFGVIAKKKNWGKGV